MLAAIPRGDGAEVTVECNPDTVTADLLATYRAAGVNRLSFGVQSMVPHVLARARAARTTSTTSGASVALARDAGFDTFNLDLIYGAAGESLDDWSRTLDEVLALEPPHVSAYALTVEPGTPLALDAARHPNDDDQADKYALACERLAAAGLEWYEISNFARAGTRVPAQPPVLAAGRLPRHRLRRALASRRTPLVERAHARALHRRDHIGRLARGRERATRCTTNASSKRCSSRCERVTAYRSTHCRSTTSTSTA